jgi:hypothetical protein
MMSKTFMGFSRSAVRIFSRSVIAVPRFGDADVAQQIRESARPTTALRSFPHVATDHPFGQARLKRLVILYISWALRPGY